MFGPPMSPPLPPSSLRVSSKSYEPPSDTDQPVSPPDEDNWRSAPSELLSSLTPTLNFISSNPTYASTSTASAAVSPDNVDPWAVQEQSTTPHASLILPNLAPFPQTSVFKAYQTALKLTKNNHVARQSVLTRFVTQPTSFQFEKWESSLRLKKDLTTEEMDEDTVPKGWKLSVEVCTFHQLRRSYLNPISGDRLSHNQATFNQTRSLLIPLFFVID